MKTRQTVFSIASLIGRLLIILIFPVLMSAQNIKNVVLYYAVWNYGPWNGSIYHCPPESLDLRSVTHIVNFDDGNISTTPPYCTYMTDSTSNAQGARQNLLYAAWNNGGSWPTSPTPWQQRLLTKAAANNVKVLLTIQAVDSRNLNTVSADSSATETLTRTFSMFAKRFGYSGLELDWEGWIGGYPDEAIMARFVRILRRNMNAVWGTNPRPDLMISCQPQDSLRYRIAQDSCVTSYIMQMYNFDQNWGGCNYSCNVSWYISPLYTGANIYPNVPFPPSGCPTEVGGWDQRGPNRWKILGHDISRIGALLPAYGTIYRGDTTLHACYNSSSTSLSYNQCLDLLKYGGQYRRDEQRGSEPYIAGTATSAVYGLSVGQRFRVTFEDSISTARKMAYMNSTGCNTVGFYDIAGAIDKNADASTRAFPFLNWIRAGLVENSSPLISLSESSLSFGNMAVNTISNEQSYIISGSHLTPAGGNITVTAPIGFQISKASGSGYTSSLTYAYTGGLLTATAVYVRFQPTVVQSYTGGIIHAGGGAATINTAVSGTGVFITATFTATPQTLPSGGGTVTLNWSSQNASAASIDQGIGTVAVNDSIDVGVASTKTFTLTLSNGPSSVQYSLLVQVSDPPAVVSDEVIYEDVALASAWSDVRSWSVSRNYNSTTQVYEGNSAIQIAHSPWASLQFSKGTWAGFTPIDPSGYESLTFAIHGGSTGVTVQITCVDNGNVAQKTAVSVTAPANSWLLKTIPMSQLASTPFTAVAITAGSANTTFSLDELDLVKKEATSVENEITTPKYFALEQNYPNPFNPTTEISYQLSTTSEVQLIIYDILGKEITTLVNKVQRAGHYSVTFNANNLASGMYYARLQAEAKVQIRKMVLMK